MSTFEREYECQPKWYGFLVGAAISAVCSLAFAWIAMTPGLFGSPHYVDKAFLFGACAILAVSAYCVLQAFHRLLRKPRIALTESAIILTGFHWSLKPIVIEYAAISALSVSRYGKQPQSVRITHSNGKRRLSAAMFPRKEAFDEFVVFLIERAPQALDRLVPSTLPYV